VDPQRSCCFTTKQPRWAWGIILLLLEAWHPIPHSPVEHTLVDHRRESGRDRIWRYFNIVSLSDMAGTSFA
jgi:hypothetical protein